MERISIQELLILTTFGIVISGKPINHITTPSLITKRKKKLRLHSLVTTVIDMTEKICCCIVDSWDPLRSKFSTPGIAKILQITGNLLQFMDFTVVSSCVTECMKLLPIQPLLILATQNIYFSLQNPMSQKLSDSYDPTKYNQTQTLAHKHSHAQRLVLHPRTLHQRM